MADDIERAPGLFSFVPQRPRFRQAAQKRFENRGSTGEKSGGVLQVVLHGDSSVRKILQEIKRKDFTTAGTESTGKSQTEHAPYWHEVDASPASFAASNESPVTVFS